MNSYTERISAEPLPRRESLIVRFMKQRPLLSYFLLAYGLFWAWLIPMFAIWHQQVIGPWLILGPSLAGVIMAGVTEGRAGIINLLKRVLIWRVGLPGYLVALLLMPVIWLLSIASMPGAAAAFQAPGSSFLPSVLAAFGTAFFSALVLEEFGWRGFALPRLQAQYGPLIGTLILGVLWGFWHLPLRAFQPNDLPGANTGLWGFAVAFLLYVCETAAGSYFFTWVFNHSRGSILLALLLHASTNAAGATFLSLFPALFPQPVIPVALEIGDIAVGVLIVLVTRGRLGYDVYCRDMGKAAR